MMRQGKKSAASFIVYYNFVFPRERERSQEGMLLNEFMFMRKTSDEALSLHERLFLTLSSLLS